MPFDSEKWLKHQEETPKDIELVKYEGVGYVSTCFRNPENPKQVCAEIEQHSDWVDKSYPTQQRLITVFDEAIEFDSVVINKEEPNGKV